jgi:signal transduction histidine kinase
VATVATWVRSLLLTAEARPDSEAAQIEALRLLTELRNVARQLPGSLDPTTTGETILERARALCRFDVGGVLVASRGGSLLRMAARVGAERPDWNLSMSADSALADAWMTQQAQVRGEGVLRAGGSPGPGSCLVVPLVSGGRSVGLVVLESSVAQSFNRDTGALVRVEVDKLVLQLQTGMVFDEVRELATNEERRRLAREIHDGIAQELAYLGYALDNVANDLADPQHEADAVAQVDQVRKEVRRLVTELRMSLFDLRADVDPSEGLGAAIGRHVRAVGAASGMTVHLSLNESPSRLSAETEAELLRIVQEAVANARKHAQAENLWVTCTVDPPHASVCVEDDGLGLTPKTSVDSHGLAIMRERAERIRAQLTLTARTPCGTRIEAQVGTVRP